MMEDQNCQILVKRSIPQKDKNKVTKNAIKPLKMS